MVFGRAPQNRTTVNPFKLAIDSGVSAKIVPFRSSQLQGFSPRGYTYLGGLSGLVNDIIGLGEQWLSNKLEAAGIGGTDIVNIQNQVGIAMDTLSSQYYALRDSHQATVATVTQYQQAFQSLINSFCARCRQIGTTRALNGCSTITYWGQKWIQDREIEKQQISQGQNPGGSVVIDPVTGLPISYQNPPIVSSSITTYLPWVLGAIAVYAMVNASKHK